MNRRRAFYFAARGWVLAVLFGVLVWSRAVSDAPLRWEMLALVGAGMLLRAWAGAHLGAHGNGGKAEAPTLAMTGPYAFSRNPLYLSNIAIGAGLLFFSNALPPVDALLVMVFILAHHFSLVRWEEKRLRSLWPAEYPAYAGRVPRWFSVRPPKSPAPSTEPGKRTEWSAVLRMQGRNLFYAVACVLILWIASRF